MVDLQYQLNESQSQWPPFAAVECKHIFMLDEESLANILLPGSRGHLTLGEEVQVMLAIFDLM